LASTAAHLVDTNAIGEILESLFLAVENLVTDQRLRVHRHEQGRSLVAGTGLEVVDALDGQGARPLPSPTNFFGSQPWLMATAIKDAHSLRLGHRPRL
jgi:hypothetical protein